MQLRTPTINLIAIALALFAGAGCQTDMALQALSGPPMDAASDSSSGSSTEGGGGASGITLTTLTSDSVSGTGTTADTDATDGTTSDPSDPAPPELLDVSLWPAVITANGPITVEVDAAASEGVHLVLDTGDTIELAEDGPGHFVGEIPVLTAADNGQHSATVIAWRGDLSDEADEPYTVELPPSGSELLWEAADSPFMGKGWVVAMATLPTGEVVELITRNGEDGRSCALRRRSPQGEWSPNSVVDLLPGTTCEAIDLVIGEDGTIHTLLSRKVGFNSWRWSLQRMPTVDGEAIEVASGFPDEEATALALRDETGAVAVCGATPSGFGDLDAFVRVYEPGEWEKVATFDAPVAGEEHRLDETPRGCIYVEDDRLRD